MCLVDCRRETSHIAVTQPYLTFQLLYLTLRLHPFPKFHVRLVASGPHYIVTDSCVSIAHREIARKLKFW